MPDVYDIPEIMALAIKVAKASNFNYGTSVGAVLVCSDGTTMVSSPNKYPENIREDQLEILVGKSRKAKSVYAVHAETSVIMEANRLGIPTAGASVYVTRYPCVSCMAAMANAGISRVYFLDTKDIYDEIHRYLPFSGIIKMVEVSLHEDGGYYAKPLDIDFEAGIRSQWWKR